MPGPWRWLVWFSSLGLSFFLGPPLFGPPSFAPASAAERVLTVGVYDHPPKIHLAENGKPAGIFIDILESIAVKEGWKLCYRYGTWQEGLDRLQKGEIDLMPDVAYSGERAARFSFHREPVLASWSQVYVPRGSSVKSLPDLDGKRVAVLGGSIQQEAFEGLARSFGLSPRIVSLSWTSPRSKPVNWPSPRPLLR